MLKHTSSKLDIGTSLSDLDDSKDDVLFNTSFNNTTLDKNSEIKSHRSERSLTDILPKPTIQKIIERRNSDLATKNKHQQYTLQPPNNLNTSELNLSKEKYASKESIHSTKEFIEEVQLDNSTYLIHKRKKADPHQKRNLSDTSTESGIASQISEITQQQQNYDNYDNDDDETESSPKQTNDQSEIRESIDRPLAVSSPIRIDRQPQNNHHHQQNHRHQHRSESINNKNDFTDINQQKRISNNRTLKPYKQQQFHTIERTHSRPSSLHIDTTIGSATDRPHTHYSRPTSARTDIYVDSHGHRYRPHRISNDQHSLGSSARSTGLLVPHRGGGQYANSSCTLPARLKKGTLRHKETFGSISAGSSISNIPPQTARSVCSCHTSRPGLSDIREDMPVFSASVTNSPEYIYQERKRKVRYVCIFLVIFAAISCLVGGFLHFYVGHFPEDFRLNEGDVKLLSFSPSYCKGVKVSSNDAKSRLITFETDENADKTERLAYTRTVESITLYPKQIWERDFYLLGGSEIEIFIETDSLLDIMVFQGENSHSIWKNRRESESYLIMKSCCSNQFPRQGVIKFSAKTTDRYFIVLYSRIEIVPISIKTLRMSFDRVSYDFTSTVSSCNADLGNECTVDYPFSGNNEIAIEVPLEPASNRIATSSSLQYMCVAREWFYCVFFAGIFMLLTLCIFILYQIIVRLWIPSVHCCCYRADEKEKKFDLVYYDNYGHATSDMYLNDLAFDSVSHARSYAPSRKSELKSNYDDATSYARSHTSRTPRNHHRTPRHAYDNMGHSHDIAAIYRDELDLAENADSGISMNPEVSPSGASSSITAQEMQAIHEQRLVHLQRGHHGHHQHHHMRYISDPHSLNLANGPSVKSLLTNDRSHSVAPTYNNNTTTDGPHNHHQKYLSHPDLRTSHRRSDKGVGETLPGKYLQATPPPRASRYGSRREHVDTEHHEYNFEDDVEFEENEHEEDYYSDEDGGDDVTAVKNLDYDDREIFI